MRQEHYDEGSMALGPSRRCPGSTCCHTTPGTCSRSPATWLGEVLRYVPVRHMCLGNSGRSATLLAYADGRSDGWGAMAAPDETRPEARTERHEFALERYRYILQQIHAVNENAHRFLAIYQTLATTLVGATLALFVGYRNWGWHQPPPGVE